MTSLSRCRHAALGAGRLSPRQASAAGHAVAANVAERREIASPGRGHGFAAAFGWLRCLRTASSVAAVFNVSA